MLYGRVNITVKNNPKINISILFIIPIVTPIHINTKASPLPMSPFVTMLNAYINNPGIIPKKIFTFQSLSKKILSKIPAPKKNTHHLKYIFLLFMSETLHIIKKISMLIFSIYFIFLLYHPYLPSLQCFNSLTFITFSTNSSSSNL